MGTGNYKSVTKTYEGIPKRLWELVYFISPDGGVLDIRKESISDKVDYIRMCARYLVFDLEILRREHRYLSDIERNVKTKRNQEPKGKELSNSEKVSLKMISCDWPDELKGLTEVYKIFASIRGECTYKQSINNPYPMDTYANMFNPIIKSLDDFIDFLIICAKLIQHDITSTKNEINSLEKKINSKEKSSPNFSQDFLSDE